MAGKPAIFGLVTFLLYQVTCRTIAPRIVAHPVGEIEAVESSCINAISASTTGMSRSPTRGLSKAGSLHHHVKRMTKFVKPIYRAFRSTQRKPYSTRRKPSSSNREPHSKPEEELSDTNGMPDEVECCVCMSRILHSPSRADEGLGQGTRWRCGHPIHRDCEEKLIATEFKRCPVCRIDLDGRPQDTTAPPAHIALAWEEGHDVPMRTAPGQNYGTPHFEQPGQVSEPRPVGRSTTLPTRPGIPSPPLGRHQLTRSRTLPMGEGGRSRMMEESGSEVAYMGEDERHNTMESHSRFAMMETRTPSFVEDGSFHWQWRVRAPRRTLYYLVPAYHTMSPVHPIPLNHPPRHGPYHGGMPFASSHFRGPWPCHMMHSHQGHLQSSGDSFQFAYLALFLFTLFMAYLK